MGEKKKIIYLSPAYSKQTYFTKSFSQWEFINANIHDGHPGRNCRDLSEAYYYPKLFMQLEKLMMMLGNTRHIMNSGYRSPGHNKAIGSTSSSKHLLGLAVDMRFRDRWGKECSSRDVACICREYELFTGIAPISYKFAIHLDVRAEAGYNPWYSDETRSSYPNLNTNDYKKHGNECFYKYFQDRCPGINFSREAVHARLGIPLDATVPTDADVNDSTRYAYYVKNFRSIGGGTATNTATDSGTSSSGGSSSGSSGSGGSNSNGSNSFIITTSNYVLSDYFPTYTGSCTKLKNALIELTESSSANYRKKIAAANDISNYTETPTEESKLMILLRAGKLLRP